MMVCLTGADGFVGSNLTRELVRRGHAVRGMVQPNRSTVTIDTLPVSKVAADLLDPESVRRAVEGCDAIIHVAASTAIWPARSQLVRRINLEGTKNVLDAARRERVKRMVHIGTANTFAPGTKESPGTETGEYTSHKYGLDYMDSKYAAHLEVQRAAERGDVPAIEVNPTFMWGPFDRVPGAGKMILRVYRREVPGFASGGRNCVSVKDVAVAIANALTMGRVGESYILGNVNLSYSEIFTTISRVVKIPVPHRVFPNWVVRATGVAGSTVALFRRLEPVVTKQMAEISCDGHYYSPAKAVRELKLPQTPVEVAIEEALEWFLANGYIYDENGRIPRHLPSPTLV
ncbi:MAG: NAD-dependent epimerase/dehydratase family protein [Spirochaetota bacterium]